MGDDFKDKYYDHCDPSKVSSVAERSSVNDDKINRMAGHSTGSDRQIEG